MTLHQIKVIGLLLAASFGLLATGLPVQATSRNQCPGFRVVRDRSDSEAPRLPRVSIAARAIQSPDGCDRSEAQPRTRTSTETRSNPSETPSPDLPAPANQEPVPVQ